MCYFVRLGTKAPDFWVASKLVNWWWASS